ncbi:MAG TPA: ribonuclease Y [Candidatus Saccharibacteria bacterium]|nr:ribonuclease Y [Candidatus Saccharibacteria bacterium]HMT39672.1 ribonuclease Y [Candidatus Saccharibacteria bacterium]
MPTIFIIVAILGAGALGYGGSVIISKQKNKDNKAASDKILEEAKVKSKEQILQAKEEALKILNEAKDEDKKRRERLDGQEKRSLEREKLLDSKLETVERRAEALQNDEKEIEAIKQELRDIRTRQEKNLEKIAKLKKQEAIDKLMAMTEKEIKADLVEYVEKLKRDAKENADEDSKEIMAEAMERMATSQATERTITTVAIPNDEAKGKIIGKEGRNIQAFERLTGVDVLIDESPGVITLSGFDPVRRQVARVAMEQLVKDGRIHPGRIEEIVSKAQKEIDQQIKKAGEDAAREAKVFGLPPEINKLMGQLKFRTSFSQNVLHHSVEMAHLAAMIAEQIGADVKVTRTAAYLHDLGKAVSHDTEGKHHHITGDIMRKEGFDEATAHAAEAHHDDIEATTAEALIVRAVDALSAGRPGARGDSAENFGKRMTDLENVTKSFPGVEKVYAMSAGREIRVFVNPENIDDLTAIKLARDVATKIEATLKYPGTIKVNVIRETRAVEFAK